VSAAITDGRDVVRVADRMTDVVLQELSGQQRTLHGRTTTVTVLGKPKVHRHRRHCILVQDSLLMYEAITLSRPEDKIALLSHEAYALLLPSSFEFEYLL